MSPSKVDQTQWAGQAFSWEGICERLIHTRDDLLGGFIYEGGIVNLQSNGWRTSSIMSIWLAIWNRGASRNYIVLGFSFQVYNVMY